MPQSHSLSPLPVLGTHLRPVGRAELGGIFGPLSRDVKQAWNGAVGNRPRSADSAPRSSSVYIEYEGSIFLWIKPVRALRGRRVTAYAVEQEREEAIRK